ncbi:MAG: NAD(P)H-binding protein [Acidimicrobiia bacterium]
MPVIVVGADTGVGRAIIEGLYDPSRDIRAFVSDEEQGAELKERGIKVALGDVSDESHIEGAAMNCFTAVLVAEASADKRERSFAASPAEVLAGWARAVASVTRVIWVSGGEVPDTTAPESAQVDPGDPDVVAKVVALDDAQKI